MSETRYVLVVDDEPADNEVLCLTIRGLGFEAEGVFDGPAALAATEARKPALVFLDALLPKLDGFAVLAEMRKRWPDVPVVMVSGIYRKRTYESEAVERLGAKAYLVKPVALSRVWEQVERLVGRPATTSAAGFSGVPFWRRPLAAVVWDVRSANRTGLLFVRSSEGSAVLTFVDGAIVQARCNDAAVRLERMPSAQRLGPDALARLGELCAAGHLGDAAALLLLEGLCSEDESKALAAEQQQGALTRPFTWAEGSCAFHATEAPRQERHDLRIDEAALVLWACRQLRIDENLVRWLPRGDRTFALTADGATLLGRLELSPHERDFVRLIDGSRPLAQLRATGRLLQVDADRLLAAMHALNIVKIAGGHELSAAPPVGAMIPAAGDLAHHAPAVLLVGLAFGRKTGMLQFEPSPAATTATRTVWLEEGSIAFASSSDPADRLGQVLLREQLLSREALAQALRAAQQSPGVALGRILVELGALSPDDLHRALVLQVRHVVGGALSITEGIFRFQEMPLRAKDIVPLGLDTPQVLMHAFRTCPFGELARRLPPPQIRMRRLPACHDLAADLPLTALEDRLLLEVDGVATLQELAARAPEGVEPVLRAAGALLSIGLIEGFLGAARPMASAPPVASSAEDQVPPITARLGAPSPSRPGGFDGGDESFGSAEPATSTAVDDDMDWEDSPSEIGAPETPAIAAETSFLALDAHVAGAAPPSDDELPLHDGSWEMPTGWAEAPPPTDGCHATQRSAQGAAVAVAEAPRLETGVDLHALAAFLLELAATLRQHPSAVPEHVRVLLPPDVRSRFGL